MSQGQVSLFIVIEGIDGAGKSTFAKRLYQELKKEGFDCLLTFEPTKEKWGKQLRLSFTSKERLTPEEELALFLKDRKEHLENVIIPGLKHGRIVISDRYYYSTVAYQGARGLNPEKILDLSKKTALTPDICFLLVISPEEGIKRIKEGRGEDTNNFEGLDYLKKVSKIYDKMKEPEIVRLDAKRPLEELLAEAKDNIYKKIQLKKNEAREETAR